MKTIKKYGGLRLKPNFDELITNLETDHPRRSLPSRAATTLRNSHPLTQLDGDTLTDLNEMETRMQKDKLRYIILKEQASQAGISIAEAAAHTEADEGYPASYYTGSMPASSSSRYQDRTLSSMSSPEHYRIGTPYQTRENTPLQTPFRTREQLDDERDDAALARILQQAADAEQMLQDNTEALIARQLASLDLVDEATPASSGFVSNVLAGAFSRLNLDDASSGSKQTQIAQKHLGSEDTPSPQFNEMMARGSAARGSNDPTPPATAFNGNTNPKYWKKQNKTYLLEQLKISGWDPPHPDTSLISKKELYTKLFEVRGIQDNETEEKEIKPQKTLKQKQTAKKK